MMLYWRICTPSFWARLAALPAGRPGVDEDAGDLLPPVRQEDGAQHGMARDEAPPGLLDALRPDLVFYNAGVDPHRDDKLGRLALTAIGTRDFPLLQGEVLVYAAVIVFLSFLVDLAYGFLDPRIRYD